MSETIFFADYLPMKSIITIIYWGYKQHLLCVDSFKLVFKYSRLSLSRSRLSRSENLVPVLTWKSNNRCQNIVEKRTNCS